PYKHALEKHLAEQGRDLFHFSNDLLLYDLTSTYFEGRLEHNAKAQHGYSRDHRPDCKQVCIGLVVNRDAFPLGWETVAGNYRDAATLLPMIEALVGRFAGSQRLLCFDRGTAGGANLPGVRRRGRAYVAASRGAVVLEDLAIIRSGPWTLAEATPRLDPASEVHHRP